MQPAQVLKKVGQETGKPGALGKDELILIPRLGITLGNAWVTVPELLQTSPNILVSCLWATGMAFVKML